MAVFAIIVQPNANSEKLAPAISEHFKGANFQLDGSHGWLVSANKTAKEISETLGVADGSNGAAIIVEVASYFGRANPNTWSWLKQHWETGKAT